jgi:hypothetical protein
VPDSRNHILERILGKEGADDSAHIHSHTSERQQTAQAFSLHVESRDGKRSEGFPWAFYGGYRWRDDGESETLVVLFGARAVEITGHNLVVLVDEIREGQLNGIFELANAQSHLLEKENPENEAIITSVRTYPDFEEVFKEIKGEQDEQPIRHARRA